MSFPLPTTLRAGLVFARAWIALQLATSELGSSKEDMFSRTKISLGLG